MPGLILPALSAGQLGNPAPAMAREGRAGWMDGGSVAQRLRPCAGTHRAGFCSAVMLPLGQVLSHLCPVPCSVPGRPGAPGGWGPPKAPMRPSPHPCGCRVVSPACLCFLAGGDLQPGRPPLRCSGGLWLLQPTLSVAVRSHACEPDQFGKPGGCSDICLLGNSHKTRTCRCRSGFSLGSDGKSCKSESWPSPESCGTGRGG